VTGKVEAGFIQTGDKALVMPPNETCTVKGKHAAALSTYRDMDVQQHPLLVFS